SARGGGIAPRGRDDGGARCDRRARPLRAAGGIAGREAARERSRRPGRPRPLRPRRRRREEPPGAEPRRIARGRWGLIGLALLAAVVAFWLPRWWEMRMYRQQEKVAGVGAALLPGGVTEARKKIDPGRSAQDVVSALGKPSTESSTAGTSSHGIW